MNEIKSSTDALAQALMLSVTAPTEEKSKQALAIAEQLAAGLTEVEVARAKKMAKVLVAEADEDRHLD